MKLEEIEHLLDTYTLEEIIGIRPSRGSLAEYGITYSQVDLLENGDFDFEGIKNAINERTKMVTIHVVLVNTFLKATLQPSGTCHKLVTLFSAFHASAAMEH